MPEGGWHQSREDNLREAPDIAFTDDVQERVGVVVASSDGCLAFEALRPALWARYTQTRLSPISPMSNRLTRLALRPIHIISAARGARNSPQARLRFAHTFIDEITEERSFSHRDGYVLPDPGANRLGGAHKNVDKCCGDNASGRRTPRRGVCQCTNRLRPHCHRRTRSHRSSLIPQLRINLRQSNKRILAPLKLKSDSACELPQVIRHL